MSPAIAKDSALFTREAVVAMNELSSYSTRPQSRLIDFRGLFPAASKFTWACLLAVLVAGCNRTPSEILIRTTDQIHTPSFAADLRRVCAEGDSDLGIRPVTGARVVPVELTLGPPADPDRSVSSATVSPASLSCAVSQLM